MLRSFVIISMAARIFCWTSARWVTVNVAFIPWRNRLVIARITIRPRVVATINSRRLKPRCELEIGIFMIFIALVVAGDQSVYAVSSRWPTSLSVGKGDGHGDEIRIDRTGRQQHLTEGDGAGEVAQALGHVVAVTEDAIRARQHEALHSARASR